MERPGQQAGRCTADLLPVVLLRDPAAQAVPRMEPRPIETPEAAHEVLAHGRDPEAAECPIVHVEDRIDEGEVSLDDGLTERGPRVDRDVLHDPQRLAVAPLPVDDRILDRRRREEVCVGARRIGDRRDRAERRLDALELVGRLRLVQPRSVRLEQVDQPVRVDVDQANRRIGAIAAVREGHRSIPGGIVTPEPRMARISRSARGQRSAGSV